MIICRYYRYLKMGIQFDSYEHFPPILIDRKIEFLVSPRAAEYHEFWDSNLQKANDTYRLEMEKRIQDSLNKTSL